MPAPTKDALIAIVVAESEDNTIRWKTPTSIMIGLSPLKLAPYCLTDKKGAYVTTRVFNPTEHRYQYEKVRVGTVTGVVLRGGDIYGWASQPYVLEKKAGEYSLEPKASGVKIRRDLTTTVSGALRPSLHALTKSLMENVEKKGNRVDPTFAPSHLRQLAKISEGAGDDQVVRAVERALRNAKGVEEARLVCRMYGGGRERTAVTFKHLYEKHGIREVPEQWDDGISVYSKETEKMLIGAERAFDGSLYYFRLHQKDIPKY